MRWRGDVLRVCPGLDREARHAEDLVAWREEVDTEANRRDGPGDVIAEDRRIAPEAQAAGRALLPVSGVDTGGVHAHEHLRRARRGPVDFNLGEEVGRAPCRSGDRAHALGLVVVHVVLLCRRGHPIPDASTLDGQVAEDSMCKDPAVPVVAANTRLRTYSSPVTFGARRFSGSSQNSRYEPTTVTG
jgi:hypothetical protein